MRLVQVFGDDLALDDADDVGLLAVGGRAETGGD
jgi:hypothetical protein